jgi:hypothetical protein
MTTDGKTLLQTLLRVYLDTADVVAIADAKAEPDDISTLIDSLHRANALVVFSVNHPWDYYSNTDEATKDRMLAAFNGFPHVVASYLEPHQFEPYQADGPHDLDLGYVSDLRKLMKHPAAEKYLSVLSPVAGVVHEAEQASLEAARTSRDVPLKKKDIELYLQVLVSMIRGKNGSTADELLGFWEAHNGEGLEPDTKEAIRSRLAPVADMLSQARDLWPEVDGDTLMAQVLQNEDPLLHQKAPGRFLQRCLRNTKRCNLDRNSKRSDAVDLHHVQFLPYVDVFTTDKENEAILRPLVPGLRRIRASRLLRVGRLREVSAAIDEMTQARTAIVP